LRRTDGSSSRTRSRWTNPPTRSSSWYVFVVSARSLARSPPRAARRADPPRSSRPPLASRVRSSLPLHRAFPSRSGAAARTASSACPPRP
jgi:hypothetical protein